MYMLSTRDPLQNKRFTGAESEGRGKIFHANGDLKKARVTILNSNKIDFKTRALKRDKQGHCIILKGSIQQEDVTHLNVYATNIRGPKYIKKMLVDFKEEINSNTVIVGDFTTLLVIIG